MTASTLQPQPRRRTIAEGRHTVCESTREAQSRFCKKVTRRNARNRTLIADQDRRIVSTNLLGDGCAMRQDLIFSFVRECQIFAGRVSRFHPRSRLARIVSTFAECIPGDLSPAETMFVGRILEKAAIGFAQETHASFHREFDLGGDVCPFDPVKAAAGQWIPLESKPLREAFRLFTADYLLSFDASHPIPAAVRAAGLVRRHFAHGMTIPTLAHHVGCHPARLRVEFRRRYGASIRQYRTGCRLRRAARLLKHTNLSISEIAERVGFGSRDAFYAAFRRRYRVTPGEYRASSRRAEGSPPDRTSNGRAA
jgi:AraC-like DNA-binding protein